MISKPCKKGPKRFRKPVLYPTELRGHAGLQKKLYHTMALNLNSFVTFFVFLSFTRRSVCGDRYYFDWDFALMSAIASSEIVLTLLSSSCFSSSRKGTVIASPMMPSR